MYNRPKSQRSCTNRMCVASSFFFFSSRRRHTRFDCDWSSDVCSSDLLARGLLRWTGGRTFTGHLFGTREEFRLVMQESAQAFTSEERAMINRVLDLQHLTVGQIATPLEKAATVTTRTQMSEALRLCRERNLTRLPVWQDEDGRRRVAGVVSLKTLLYQSG